MTDYALEISGLKKQFGDSKIITGVDLKVKSKERVAVIGPNGAGKSTLFNLISGRLQSDTGSIKLNGSEISGKKPHNINRMGLSRSFQVTNIFPTLTVFENLRCAVLWGLGYKYCFWKPLNNLRDVNENAEELLVLVGLRHLRNRVSGLLTYAEQRALEIGVTVGLGSDVLLLDEPTAGMSNSETDVAIELIRTVSENRTLLMVEHDMGVVFGLADKIAVLVYGEIIAMDTPEKIKGNPKVIEAYLGTDAHEEVA